MNSSNNSFPHNSYHHASIIIIFYVLFHLFTLTSILSNCFFLHSFLYLYINFFHNEKKKKTIQIILLCARIYMFFLKLKKRTEELKKIHSFWCECFLLLLFVEWLSFFFRTKRRKNWWKCFLNWIDLVFFGLRWCALSPPFNLWVNVLLIWMLVGFVFNVSFYLKIA